MIRTIIIFLIVIHLLGPVVCLFPGKQFTYNYEGTVENGIPEIRNRVTGAGIRATVILQAEANRTIVKVDPLGSNSLIVAEPLSPGFPTWVIASLLWYQMQNIRVGTFSGDVKGDFSSPMPIHYTPLSGYGKILEEPFLMDLRRDSGDVMEVTPSEQEWITNLRKSIAGLFLISPIRKNFGALYSGHLYTDQLEEPSIFGSCSAKYTQLPSSPFSATERKLVVEEVKIDNEEAMDALSNTYLSRSIDFKKCSERVIVELGGPGFISPHEQSSVMFVQLAENSTMRPTIARGSVQGTFLMTHFGAAQDKLVSLSRQTYNLVSIQDITHPIRSPVKTKKIATWYMEVASPYSPDKFSPRWINFYNSSNVKYAPLLLESITSGIPITPKKMTEFKTYLDSLLDKTGEMVMRVDPVPSPHHISPFSTDEAQMVTNMEYASQVANGINVTSLNDLFDQYLKDTSEKGQIKLTLLIDACAASGGDAPTKMILEKMISKKISPERVASIFFTFPNNFAAPPVIGEVMSYIKNLTMDDNAYESSIIWMNFATTLKRICLSSEQSYYAIFGSQRCHKETMDQDMLPFFLHQLEKYKEPWKRTIIVQAIGNLGTRAAFSALAHVIQGHDSWQVRLSAIYALIYPRFPLARRYEVIDTLVPLVLQTEEHELLRQAAVVTLLSWPHSPVGGWWQGIPVSTWKDRSPNVASFIYFLIKDLVQNTNNEYMKAAVTARFALLMVKPFPLAVRHSDNIFWSKSIQQNVIKTYVDWGRLRHKQESILGQIFFTIVTATENFELPILSAVYNLEEDFIPLQHLLSDTTRSTGEDKSRSSADKFSTIYLRLFKNLEFFIPFSKKALNDVFKANQHKLDSGSFRLTKFLNPARNEMFLPTEIGLPLIARSSSPMVNTGQATASLNAKSEKHESPFPENVMNFTATNYKLASKTLLVIRAQIPWSEKMVASGVETMKGLTVPMQVQVTSRDMASHLNVFIHASQNDHLSVLPLVHAHTVPFIVVKNMWPSPVNNKSLDDFQFISILGEGRGVFEREEHIILNTGLSGTLRWEADVPYAFSWGNIIHYLKHPQEVFPSMTSPTARMWSLDFFLNITASRTKDLDLHFIYVHSPSDSPHDDISIDDDEDLYMSLFVNIMLTGEVSQVFEASALITNYFAEEDSRHSYLIGFNTTHSYDKQSWAYCASVEITAPEIKNFKSLLTHLSMGANAETVGQLRAGLSCRTSKQIARMNMTTSMSNVRRSIIVDEIKKSDSKFPDVLALLNTHLAYDTFSSDIYYEQDIPAGLRDVLSYCYNFIKNLLFPHIYTDYTAELNPHGSIHITGTRDIVSPNWEVNAKTPQETLRIDGFKPPAVFEQLIPPQSLPSCPSSSASHRTDGPSLW